MSFPYIPFYTADYLSKAHFLSLSEHGAYLKLLILCWETPGCSIPADREWIQRRLNVSDDEYEKYAQPVIDEFFKTDKARLFNSRLLAEYEKLNSTYKKRSKAGKKGGLSRKSLKINETDESQAISEESPAKAGNKQPEPEPEPLVKETPNGVSKTANGSRLPNDWFPEPLPADFIRKHGITQDLVQNEFEKFVDYWKAAPGAKGRKVDWQATWRTWLRKTTEQQPRGQPQRKSAMRNTMEAIEDYFTNEQRNAEEDDRHAPDRLALFDR